MKRLTDIDLRLLRIFCTVVERDGFKQARLELGMAQSTLSTHMTNLEARLGVTLCNRGRAGFRLSAAGEQTYAAALELFNGVDRFTSRMDRVHGGKTQRLRIATIDAITGNPDIDLSGAMAAFCAAHPNVFIDLDVMPADSLQRAVAEGQRDIAIGPAEPASATLTVRALASEHHALYCGSTHPWFTRDDAHLCAEDVQATGFSVRSYRYFDDVYRLGAVRASARVSNMEAQLIMILSGTCVGFLPVHLGTRWEELGRMRAVRPNEWGFHSRFQIAFDEATGMRKLKRSFARLLMPDGPGGPAID